MATIDVTYPCEGDEDEDDEDFDEDDRITGMLGLARPDDPRRFLDRLDEPVRGTSTAAARRLSCRYLSFDIRFLREGFPVVLEHGTALLGTLLTLLSVSELLLLTCGDEPVPGLTASLLEALPSAGTTLNKLSLDLDTFDAPTAETLVRVIPQLRLSGLHLMKRPVVALDPAILLYILRAVLKSDIAILDMHGFNLSTIESECWDLLATNRTLKDLRMADCDLGVNTFELVASALKRNRSLQKLVLDDAGNAQGRCGAFGEALAVNSSLEELQFDRGRMQKSDLNDLSTGLRRNRTLKLLWLYGDGLTPPPQGLPHLLATVRFNNNTLDHVILPFLPVERFPLEQGQLRAACRFHKTFRASCQALRSGAAEPSDADTAFRQWWPLLGSNHPTAKATVLFCVVRDRADLAAQFLKASTSPSTHGRDGITTSLQGACTRGTKRTRSTPASNENTVPRVNGNHNPA